MKFYIATVTVEMIVMAKDENHAQIVANNNKGHECIGIGDFEIEPFDYVPAGYDDNQEVYTDNGPTMTVAEAKEKSPEYQESLKRYQAMVAKMKEE